MVKCYLEYSDCRIDAIYRIDSFTSENAFKQFHTFPQDIFGYISGNISMDINLFDAIASIRQSVLEYIQKHPHLFIYSISRMLFVQVSLSKDTEYLRKQ